MARNNDASRLQKAYIRLGVSVSVFFIGSKESCLLCGYTGTVFFYRSSGAITINLDKLQTCNEDLYRLEL